MELKLNKYAFFVFIVSFIIYLATLCPGVSLSDSGELISVAYTLGIAHPSGYPTYTLLGKLFTFVPIGSVAFRLNMMSAVFASLAVLFLFLFLQIISKNNLFAVFTSLFFAFTPSFWSQSTIAEVHSLHIFLFILSAYFIALWHEKNRAVFLYSFAFAYGLSLTNHVTSLLFAPAFLYLVWIKRNLISPKILFLCTAFFLIALTPYLYLPLRSAANPALDWGNPETLGKFIFHVTGQQYRDRMFSFSFESLANFFTYAFAQFNVFLGIAVLGFAESRRIKLKPKYFVFFLLECFFVFLFTFSYDIGDIALYHIPVYLFIAVMIGLGVLWIAERFDKRIFQISIALVLLLAFVMSVYLAFGDNLSHSRDYYDALEYSADIEKIIPEKASLIWILGNETDFLKNILLYGKYVEKKGILQNKIIAAPAMLMHPETRVQIKAENPGINYNYPVISKAQFDKNRANVDELFSGIFLKKFVEDNPKIPVFVIKGNVSEPVIEKVN